jgi:hypothetical protein
MHSDIAVTMRVSVWIVMGCVLLAGIAHAETVVSQTVTVAGQPIQLEARHFLREPLVQPVRWSLAIAPDVIEVVDSARAPADYDDLYGQRLPGWLVPATSGDFTF